MSRTRWAGFAAVALAVGSTMVAAEEPAQPPAMSPEEQAMMDRWTAFMTPGEGHEPLGERVGSWDLVVKMWMVPGAPPTESRATSETKWILGGRYLEDITHGTFQDQPFEGRGIVGYDNLKKTYVSTWIDNMGTGIMTAEGTYDPSTKSFRFAGVASDPMSGTTKTVRSVEKVLGPDSWTVEMYDTAPDGTEFKSMEITYARKK